jgi:hypothetical protein
MKQDASPLDLDLLLNLNLRLLSPEIKLRRRSRLGTEQGEIDPLDAF